MAEWLDPENTTQDLLNELADESDHIAKQVLFWPTGVQAGNFRNQGSNLISKI
jgi:hypothetical protein